MQQATSASTSTYIIISTLMHLYLCKCTALQPRHAWSASLPRCHSNRDLQQQPGFSDNHNQPSHTTCLQPGYAFSRHVSQVQPLAEHSTALVFRLPLICISEGRPADVYIRTVYPLPSSTSSSLIACLLLHRTWLQGGQASIHCQHLQHTCKRLNI